MGFKGCIANFDPKKKKQKYPNIPSSLPMIAEVVAKAKNISISACAKLTTENAIRFFA